MSAITEKNYIDAKGFEELITSGAAGLRANKQTINDLNVFPIPDGDTGDNMYMTLGGGLSGLRRDEGNTLEAKSAALADGMILNARGNSGVILSQFFAGMARGFQGVEAADAEAFLKALTMGVKQAYSAVVTPTEGTVLTVAREATEYMEAHLSEHPDLRDFFRVYVDRMRISLDKTPELLSVLAEAGVVDSGGAGLLSIFEGMLAAAEGKSISSDEDTAPPTEKELDFSKFSEDDVMSFGYCTELLLRLQRCKVESPGDFDISVIIDYLGTIGDSIAAFKTGTIVKIHVHTLTPQRVLEFCQGFGEFLTVKIENMTLQHGDIEAGKSAGEAALTADPAAFRKKRARRDFALVTVGTGRGLCDTFTEFGADFVIEGGQTKNPSVEDFISAFDKVNADHIFTLPNNSNIIMAAESAAELYHREHPDTTVHVIKTKSFGEAYSILSMLDYSSGDIDTITAEMLRNKDASKTGMISTSIRSVTLDGVSIEKDDYIGFTDKTMLLAEGNKRDAFASLLRKMCVSERDFLIVFFGADTDEADMEAAAALISSEYPHLEYYPIAGGQEVYSYIVITE